MGNSRLRPETNSSAPGTWAPTNGTQAAHQDFAGFGKLLLSFQKVASVSRLQVDLANFRQQFGLVAVGFRAARGPEHHRLCRIGQLHGNMGLKVVQGQKRCHLFDIRTPTSSGASRTPNCSVKSPLRQHSRAIFQHGTAGRGVHRSKLPHLGDAGRGERILAWFVALRARLRDVRVACGEWDRVLGSSVTERHGITGIVLDPPYGSAEHSVTYSAQHADVSADVRSWAVLNGDNPDLRIALCGYDGEHQMPHGWTAVHWKARGGYGSQGDGRGRENAARETIWFSRSCLGLPLFAEAIS